ncbi:hypothetical protein E2C01_029197 [Portunus trituberculatus]|uniref:Uncharacterized protein n=1 Tax=Portunus trituberculatus TaxID=210409 RepID=A0A5B7ENH8_PORTR|nr:hypothetical protein [Portunus trituberculatus]
MALRLTMTARITFLQKVQHSWAASKAARRRGLAAADRIILTGGRVAPDVRKRRDEGEAAVMNTAVRDKIYRSSVKRAWCGRGGVWAEQGWRRDGREGVYGWCK